MSPVEKEQLVRLLARAIDADEPPGLAANQLARQVVSLVQDSSVARACMLIGAIEAVRAQFPPEVE